MRRWGLGEARGVTLVELAVVLAILGVGIGAAVPLVGRALDRYRVVGAASDLYGALHLTRARARQTGVLHGLVIDGDGRTFRVVEDPTGEARTVAGPRALADGVIVSGNATIRFSPKGFAVPFGTITVRGTDGEERRLVVNILGRVRVEDGQPPR